MAKLSDDYKEEIAKEIGIDIENTDKLSCSECGKLGGKAAGKIGGEMVRRMISSYENKYLK